MTPSVSVLAEPPVAVVDKVAIRRGTADLARAYLEFFSTTKGQDIIAQHHYRPRDPAVAARYAARFPEIPMTTIADFGGWPKAQATHFAEGGVFDRIYSRK